MRNSTKPIRVAGDEEFGEKYHVAVALCLDPILRGVVIGPDNHRALPFLSLFAPERVSQIEKAGFDRRAYLKAADSTDIYCRHWSTEAPKQLREQLFKNIHCKEPNVTAWVVSKLGAVRTPAALVWIRNQCYERKRNSTNKSVAQLLTLTQEVGLRPILIGDHLDEWPPTADNLVEFFDDPIFHGEQSIASQLLMFDSLMKHCGVCVSIGMKSGGMDGPGLFLGLPTVSFFQPDPGKLRVQRIASNIQNFDTIALDVSSKVAFQQHSQTELERLKQLIQPLARVEQI